MALPARCRPLAIRLWCIFCGRSKAHAMIMQNWTGKIFIQDLGSTHGTFMNGVRLKPHEQLAQRTRPNRIQYRLSSFRGSEALRVDDWGAGVGKGCCAAAAQVYFGNAELESFELRPHQPPRFELRAAQPLDMLSLKSVCQGDLSRLAQKKEVLAVSSGPLLFAFFTGHCWSQGRGPQKRCKAHC